MPAPAAKAPEEDSTPRKYGGPARSAKALAGVRNYNSTTYDIKTNKHMTYLLIIDAEKANAVDTTNELRLLLTRLSNEVYSRRVKMDEAELHFLRVYKDTDLATLDFSQVSGIFLLGNNNTIPMHIMTRLCQLAAGATKAGLTKCDFIWL
jgi:hypothetical protein